MSARTPEERIVAMEMEMMHLQRTVADLNDVVIDAGRRIDEQQREIDRLQLLVRRLINSPQDEVDDEEDAGGFGL